MNGSGAVANDNRSSPAAAVPAATGAVTGAGEAPNRSVDPDGDTTGLSGD